MATHASRFSPSSNSVFLIAALRKSRPRYRFGAISSTTSGSKCHAQPVRHQSASFFPTRRGVNHRLLLSETTGWMCTAAYWPLIGHNKRLPLMIRLLYLLTPDYAHPPGGTARRNVKHYYQILQHSRHFRGQGFRFTRMSPDPLHSDRARHRIFHITSNAV